MKEPRIGIIGGTGLGEVLLKEAGGESVSVDTPFGSPSDDPILATWEDVPVVFIPRHGRGHRFNPSEVPYRANIWAMKTLGATAIVASGATGSLREEIQPGHLVLCDQVIDKTFRRPSTFFDVPPVVHVELAEPFCPRLRGILSTAGQRVDTTLHPKGTYICMEGPQFSTRAESNMHRNWGGDLIGMTCMPEAKLAREAEICYALVALPTDYDCWRQSDKQGGQEALLAEILGNLNKATKNAMQLIHETLNLLPDAKAACACHDALKLAIWSDKDGIDPQAKQRFEPLIGRYLTDTN